MRMTKGRSAPHCALCVACSRRAVGSFPSAGACAAPTSVARVCRVWAAMVRAFVRWAARGAAGLRVVREFPAITAVALVSRHDREATETLLRLGATGVRSAVDCTEPDGWRRLRDLVGHPASPVAARILARLVPALGDPSEETRLFFEAVARLAPALSTVRRLARHLRICSSTLMSRFYRAGLPSPKTYLAGMRLLHSAFLFQNPGLSVSDVALRMDYFSPQCFVRH